MGFLDSVKSLGSKIVNKIHGPKMSHKLLGLVVGDKDKEKYLKHVANKPPGTKISAMSLGSHV